MKKKILRVGRFLCKTCGKTVDIEQDDGIYVLAPIKCPHCHSIGPWRLLLDGSKFALEEIEDIAALEVKA